jgi:hypothetical protein
MKAEHSMRCLSLQCLTVPLVQFSAASGAGVCGIGNALAQDGDARRDQAASLEKDNPC